jgi:hypothetical protein
VTAVVVEVVVSESVTVAVKSKEVLMGTSVVALGVIETAVTVAVLELPLLFPPHADEISAAAIAAARRRDAGILLGIRTFPSVRSPELLKREARLPGALSTSAFASRSP